MRGIMEQAQQKRIVLGITGGIAAYKAAELARLLVKQGIVGAGGDDGGGDTFHYARHDAGTHRASRC